MALLDYRTKGTDELTYYVFDDLRYLQNGHSSNIFRYDTLEEAAEKFRSLPETWTTALGLSIHGTSEIDVIQRRIGESVLCMDYQKIDAFRKNSEACRAADCAVDMLGVQWQSDYGILGFAPVLIPLEKDPIFTAGDYQLHPEIPGKPLTAMLEAYTVGEGWIPAAQLLQEARNYGFDCAMIPKCTHFSVWAKRLSDGGIARPDVSPWDFKELCKRYRIREQVNRKSSLQDRIDCAAGSCKFQEKDAVGKSRRTGVVNHEQEGER